MTTRYRFHDEIATPYSPNRNDARVATICVVLFAFCFSSIPLLGDDSSEEEKFFESKVRPLIVQHCVECHGTEEQSGGLRLDLQVAVKKGGSSGKIVTPGEPDKSPLVHAIQYSDPNLQMPPSGKLKDEEVSTLVDWVRRGAFWPEDKNADSAKNLSPAQRIDQIRESHWAYRPVQFHELPSVKDKDWAKQPIDRFVLSKLEAKGLRPNSAADRRTLILRASFALVGLPPRFDEIEAFVADQSPNAFEAMVDRLLASEHYGERWARHWLDLARFAETTGYQAGSRDTRYPYAFTYRDYVIQAFNQDRPFNEFIVDQLAADQLGLADTEKHRLAAMGFLTVGRKFMGNPHDIIDDQIDVVTRAFLGTSVACARCHDHKYDPIPAADYYSLYGVFASSQEPEDLPLLGDPGATPGYDQFLAAKAEKQKEVDSWLEKERVATEEELRSKIGDYLVHLAKLLPPNNAKEVKKIGERGALRPRAVGRWQDFMKTDAAKSHPIWGVLHQFFKLPNEDYASKAKELLEASHVELANANPSVLAALRSQSLESPQDVAKVLGGKIEETFKRWKELQKQEPSATRLPDADEEAIRLSLIDPENPTSLTTDLMIALLDQAERNEYNQQLGKVKGVEVTHPGAPSRGMVMFDKPNPVEPAIFRRGQPGNRGDQVPRRFLQVLSHVDGGQPFTKGSGRLELAQAIANPDNPLTSRVIVNRIWQYHFGVGLVSTASDFGSRGEEPSHPELLDYLAAEFVKDGWSIKRLQKRILMSATWQQSSTSNKMGESVDPENRLLWRMARRRLEFEPLRDRLLSAAETLDTTIGGRSVKIHEDATRRGLYAYLDREDIPGLLASFDVPSPDASQSARARTTVPQQALYLINAKFVIQQAESLAKKTASIESIDDRIADLYRRTIARNPDESELRMAREFLLASGSDEPQGVATDLASHENLSEWRFGFGSVDEEKRQVEFRPLPHFTGKSWQGSEAMPDPKLGYVSLSAVGGHPGNDASHCAILRWVAPGDAVISIQGELKHPSDQGDGVRARVVSSRQGVLGQWIVSNKDEETSIEKLEVTKNDTIDFVVDCRESASFDGYQWKPRIRVIESSSGLEKGFVWSATRDFAKASQALAPTPKIDPWVQLSQVLMLSNEFTFVD